MAHRRERALAVADAGGARSVAVSAPGAVTWLTGYVPDIETGPSPFALSAIAVLAGDASATLVVSEDEEEGARETGCEVVTYPGFGIGPLDTVANAARALQKALDRVPVAIDAGSFPAALVADLEWVDVEKDLAQARAVKDPDEVERIRQAIAVCDAGQAAARAEARPGMTELDLWAATRGAMETAAGSRLPVLADLVSGPRTADVGGPPGLRVLEEGDLVLCDLVPRVSGYWGDSCATFAVGEPTEEARSAHARSLETLEGVVAEVHPGASAADLDALARSALDFPHHTGHGLGTSWHEEPRLVPDSAARLEPGMVVAIEPGSYAGIGVRVEQIVLVNEAGCEVLSRHSLAL
jgi:Xaa-Pro aminopeptidase